MVYHGVGQDLPRAVSGADVLQELATDDCEAYAELQMYIEDIREKIGGNAGLDFLARLSEACHLVDEANAIAREMRPHELLKFEVEFVWDIYREIEDVIVVRVMRQPPRNLSA